MRVQNPGRLLDVGCDDGEIVAQMQVSIRYALDIHPRSPDRTVRLICADARFLPLATGSFDTLTSFDVIEHIENDQAVLAELMRVLADHGTLWLSTPSANFSIFPPFLTSRASRGWGHVRNGYTPAQLKRKLPLDTEVEILYWNAAVFRFFYVLLRVLSRASPALTRTLSEWCFKLDQWMPDGQNGHLFIRVRRAAADGTPLKIL
jgi:SAM-dependent methyltransferase